jgi:sulfotransferase family protein
MVRGKGGRYFPCMTLPNFIVIGAAKAGTTALYWYLSEHPAVFMSPVKETNFFGYGRDAEGRLLYGDPEIHHFPIQTMAEYEQLFQGADGAAAIGEASPIYLECPQAAERIRAAIPTVRLIASLRQPVERAYSDYLMHLRHRGLRFDPARDLTASAPWAAPDSRWIEVSRYHAQLERYYGAFPRSQIHVALFDDLKRDALGMVQAVYRFVGVDAGFAPDFDTPHAIGGLPASRLLERMLTNRVVGAAVKPLLPMKAANWVRRMRARNLKKPPSLPPALRRELTARLFRDEIERTSRLIGRSLDHWL